MSYHYSGSFRDYPNTVAPVYPHSPQSLEHHHADLKRFAEIANEDVEMEAPPTEETKFLVIDTNVVLHSLDVLIQFVDDIERLGLPVIVIIPIVVIHELDAQKKGDDKINWFARKASAWLLKKVQERKALKGQAMKETDTAFSTGLITNDEKILRCAIYFNRLSPTFLCSGDRNLCIMCEVEYVTTINPLTRDWCSRSIAERIFADGTVDLSSFAGFKPTYKDKSIVVVQEQTRSDDSMDVDDECSNDNYAEVISRGDARNSLHLQIVQHFTALLAELVTRVSRDGSSVTGSGSGEAGLSIHAPKAIRSATAKQLINEPKDQNFSNWTATQLLDHLERRKRVLPATNPYLGIFLTEPYQAWTGGRRGEEWSAAAWETSLKSLRKIGEGWGESSFKESLNTVAPHIVRVFGEGVINV
ncbi:pinc domain-containing protein [Moniliophthora roreri MCA 2997]|uniref:Pinc domain-containing protein n=1 Tax=Moniliophthora roreri (strain MCA 2997) TaxID=1381753 RepID=V2XAA2_MONRO|nr:pinc domain-containing protein [Moniliophthora roreri MCA 2997]